MVSKSILKIPTCRRTALWSPQIQLTFQKSRYGPNSRLPTFGIQPEKKAHIFYSAVTSGKAIWFRNSKKRVMTTTLTQICLYRLRILSHRRRWTIIAGSIPDLSFIPTKHRKISLFAQPSSSLLTPRHRTFAFLALLVTHGKTEEGRDRYLSSHGRTYEEGEDHT